MSGLLNLSRIEAARTESAWLCVDLAQLAREVGEQFASRAEQAERNFALEVPVEPTTVLGSEGQLRQVVTNLLENALKFTAPDGSISMRLECAEREVVLTVSDDGIGIPIEDMQHLFERFHRGRNASSYPGNGLGLVIVKAIVEEHAGGVEAKSAGLGQGSTFIVRLPLS